MLILAPVEEVTDADTHVSGSAEGVAAGTLAAMSTVNNQPLASLIDNTQVQVGMDPSWSAAAKESYRRNEARLWGVILDFFLVLLISTASAI